MNSLFQKLSAPAVALSLFAGPGIVCAADDSALAESEASLIEALQKVGALRTELQKVASQKDLLARALAEANRQPVPSVSSDEALGTASLSEGSTGLEQRLLAAVNDLRVVEGENQALRGHLNRIANAASSYISGNPDAEFALRSEIESSVSFLGSEWTPEKAIAELTGMRAGEVAARDIKIVGVRPELGLVVLGNGTSSGLRPGMPLVIERNGETIATATLIEARKSLAGAVLTGASLEDAAVTVGDIAQLATSESIIGR